MKILHVASFKGNYGDIINHTGLYKMLNTHLKKSPFIKQLEIRLFYRNENLYRFDDEFVDEVNKFDLLILGGGGFFDVRFNDSSTGTTIDISKSVIDRIQIPVLINAMGYHEFEGEYEEAKVRFKKIILYVQQKKNWFVTFRNDGSILRINRTIEEDSPSSSLSPSPACTYTMMPKRKYVQYSRTVSPLIEVPDNGFFFTDLDVIEKPAAKIIGVNITNDEFTRKFNGNITIERFNKEISKVISSVVSKGFRIIFFLHTPQDIQTLSLLQNFLGPKYFRYNIEIAPYNPTNIEATKELEYYYRKCRLIVAMRFHSTILAIQNGILVIGLAGHEQISSLYEELDLEDQFIRVGEDNYIAKLEDKIINVLDHFEKYSLAEKKVVNSIKREGKLYYKRIAIFLSKYYPDEILT